MCMLCQIEEFANVFSGGVTIYPFMKVMCQAAINGLGQDTFSVSSVLKSCCDLG